MAADNLSPLPKRLLGLAMLGLVVALLALCVAVYAKVFTATVPVSVLTLNVESATRPSSLSSTGRIRIFRLDRRWPFAARNIVNLFKD